MALYIKGGKRAKLSPYKVIHIWHIVINPFPNEF